MFSHSKLVWIPYLPLWMKSWFSIYFTVENIITQQNKKTQKRDILGGTYVFQALYLPVGLISGLIKMGGQIIVITATEVETELGQVREADWK